MNLRNPNREGHMITLAPCLQAACILLPAAFAAGAVYHVDNAHAAASDTTTGALDSPWPTIQHAAENVGPGDTVMVHEGEYDERVTCRESGTASARVVFRAAPGEEVTMWGFYTRNCDYVTIEGFSITGDSSLTSWTDRAGVFATSDFVHVIDNYFFELSCGVRTSWTEPYPRGGRVLRNRAYRCQYGMTINGIDWLIEDNEVERLVWRGSGDADYARLFGENIVFRGNRFHGTRKEEIGSAHVDCWQTFTNNGEYLRDIVIEANLCESCHQGFMASNVTGTDCGTIIVRNNVFAHTWAWGLCVHDIGGWTVDNNTFVDINYHAAGFRGDSRGNVVRNNIFVDAGSGYWANDGAEVDGSYNLLYNTNGGAGDPHTITGEDPLFVDPGSGDYRLQDGSPAIDKGMTLETFAVDHRGVVRPQEDGWDIGAYEYVSTATVAGRRAWNARSYDERGRADFRSRAMPPAGKIITLYDPRGRTVAVLSGHTGSGVFRPRTAPPGSGIYIRAFRDSDSRSIRRIGTVTF
jgi:hypothetical protein